VSTAARYKKPLAITAIITVAALVVVGIATAQDSPTEPHAVPPLREATTD